MSLIYLNLGMVWLDRPRSEDTWINDQRANGIQEVDGSIPFGSTSRNK